MGFLDKLFGGNNKKPEEGQIKVSESGMPYIEVPAKKGPCSAEDHINESVNLFVSGDYGKALEHANMAVNLEPQNADAYSVRATARRKMGDIPGAEADEEKAEELSPERNGDDDYGYGSY